MKEEKTEKWYSIREWIKHTTSTSTIYTRRNFEKLLKETNNSPIAISHMSSVNESMEKLESLAPILAGGSFAFSIHCAVRLFKFRLLTPAGRLGSILGLGFGIFMFSGMIGAVIMKVQRKNVEILEAMGEFDKAKEYQEKFPK